MERYGVWSDLDGGFVANGPTKAEAEKAREDLITEDEPEQEDNLKVISVCPDHEDEPMMGCSYCDADDVPDAWEV